MASQSDLTRYRKVYPFYRQAPVYAAVSSTPAASSDCCVILNAAAPASSVEKFADDSSNTDWTPATGKMHAVEIDCIATSGRAYFLRKKFFALINEDAEVIHSNTVDFSSDTDGGSSSLYSSDFYVLENGDNTYSVVFENNSSGPVNAKCRFSYLEVG